jgi:hypothetical protein
VGYTQVLLVPNYYKNHSNQALKSGIFIFLHPFVSNIKGKGKAIPTQAWTGPQGSGRLRLPEGGKVVSPTHWPPLPLPPGNIPGTHFC